MEQASGVDERRAGPLQERAAIRGGRHGAFSHQALLYAGDDELATGAARFVATAFEAGEQVVLAVRAEREGLLREVLADDARSVMFCDIEVLARNPARLIPAWLRLLDQHADGARGLAMLAESVWPGRSDEELSECARYEALLNVAFGRGRAWRLLCPYDVDALDDEIVELARSTHPLLCLDGRTEASRAFAGADAARPLEGKLSEPPAGARALTFTITSLHEVREFVSEAAHAARLSSQRTENLRLAVNELASNSVCHGGGAGTLRTWRDEEALVCQVSDHGRIRERMVGRLRPDPDQTSGRGLWLVNHLCDLVQIRSGDHGSVVRAYMRLAGEGAAELA
jgi:anti-sigma regulatory factor (Ser/Thr protein kinase)